jgi:hypothetical protein
MFEVLARARRTLQTAAWVQFAGAILAVVMTVWLLARWRRRWPMVPALRGRSTWARTLLWSCLCLLVALVCLKIARPLRGSESQELPQCFVVYQLRSVHPVTPL